MHTLTLTKTTRQHNH